MAFVGIKPNISKIQTQTTILQQGKGKGKVAPLLNKAPRHEDILGEWKYSSTHS
jgi:hypothetical protein